MAQVFVVDRAGFFGGDWPQGFRPLAGAEAAAFLRDAHAKGRFVEREVAERTPAWKQWIPYCVLRCRARATSETTTQPAPDAPLEGLFCVQRTSGQGESRLHGAWSIGLGGHIDPEDATVAENHDSAGFFAAALVRELTEELACGRAIPAPRFTGLLNDDSTPVGAVHAGLVYVWDLVGDLALARQLVQVREVGKMRGGFGSLVEFRELWQDPVKFESWSRFLIHAGIAGLPARGSLGS